MVSNAIPPSISTQRKNQRPTKRLAKRPSDPYVAGPAGAARGTIVVKTDPLVEVAPQAFRPLPETL
jgi:hypothetical protein